MFGARLVPVADVDERDVAIRPEPHDGIEIP
jgi:hypothetical protein